MKINYAIIFFIVIMVISFSRESLAINFYRGSLHQHTGFSTLYGYDSNPLTSYDNCLPIGLEGNFIGYDVQELADQAGDLRLDYLGFSDHSYCLDAPEFNTVRTDCQNAQDSGFTCLWGEELSAAETVNEIESAWGCDPTGLTDDGGY